MKYFPFLSVPLIVDRWIALLGMALVGACLSGAQEKSLPKVELLKGKAIRTPGSYGFSEVHFLPKNDLLALHGDLQNVARLEKDSGKELGPD